MNTKISIVGKIISGVLISIVLSIFLTFTGYDTFELSNLIPIFTVTFCLTVLIGIPCSIITDVICCKIQGIILHTIAGLGLHLLFAGVTAYLFIMNDNTLNYDIFIFSIISSAVGLWLIDTILRNWKNIFNISKS